LKRVFLVICFVALILGIAGCSGAPSIDTGSDKVTAKKPEQKQNQDTNQGQVTKTQETKPQQEQTTDYDKALTEELKKYMFENYGGNGNPEYETSWYSLIKEIKAYSDGQDKWAVVKTDIYRDDEGKNAAVFLARTILAGDIVGRVEIDDQDGFPLAQELK